MSYSNRQQDYKGQMIKPYFKTLLPLSLILLALAGCNSVQWTRPDTSDSQVQMDSQNCQSKAMNINKLVQLQPNAPESIKAATVVQTEWQSCMRELGYTTR